MVSIDAQRLRSRNINTATRLIEITQQLRRDCDALRFAEPVAHVYNPLAYAWAAQQEYLQRFGDATGRCVLLGMNPGPYGMVQTGVPFGEVAMVRDWMQIQAPIAQPAVVHPKRPIQGFDCRRSEVSGRRLWGWAAARYGSAEQFFARYFVVNYCPLVFMEAGGRNRTPDKLAKSEREALYAICDQALCATLECLQPSLAIGIGKFAEQKLLNLAADADYEIGCAPHPSPASPVANRGWPPLMDAVADRYGL